MVDFAELSQIAFSKITGIADNPSLRYFWIYILFGMVIAIVAHRLRGDNREFSDLFFRREVWLSRSAYNDYILVILNPIIYALLFSWIFSYLVFITPLISSKLVALGEMLPNGEGSIGIAIALTLTLYLVNDFMRWWLHYLQHKIPVLWEFHKVHHSAEQLNFATAERHHPLDYLFFAVGVVSAAAVVNGIYIGLFGDKLTVYQISGANIIFVMSNLIGGVLRHSPAWVSFGPHIEKWLISPAMHQIHHSSDPKHFDKNMGGGLAIWDRLGGTLYVPEQYEELSFGIGKETSDYRTLRGIYIDPLVKAARLYWPGKKDWTKDHRQKEQH